MSDDVHGDDARAAAEKLILAASQAKSPHKSGELARRALAVWPDCADAFNLLGELAGEPVEAADLYRRGIEAARRAVGQELFAAAQGSFGAQRETRPYLRAVDGLAGAMMQLNLTREAVTLWRELLRLDRADSMAVREYLAVALLALEELEELEELLQGLEGTTAIPAYSRALFAFRRGRADADPLLQEAIARNRYTPAYLLGEKALPADGPSYVGLGAESEAQAGAGLLIDAWRRTEGAIAWLAEQVRRAPPPPRRRRAAAEEEVALPECYEGLPRLWGQLARAAVLLDAELAARGLDVRTRARAARIWASYASEQRPRVRNPGAQAAAVDYLLGKAFDLHGESRAQLAGRYGASPKTISGRAATIEDWLRASPLGPELAPEWFEDDAVAGGQEPGARASVAKVIPFPGGRRLRS